MTGRPLFDMLDNAMICLGFLPNAIMPDGVVGHVTPIDQESQATHVTIMGNPMIAESPEINCLFQRIAEVQIASGHLKHDWALGVVLQGVLRICATFELADVSRATSALVAALRTPTIPYGGEHCCVDSGSHYLAQLDQVFGNHGAVMTREPVDAIRDITPSFNFIANSLDSTGG